MKFEKFLEQKSEPGFFDSEGQFTIESARAVSKTSAYALADPKHWILKVIQAAVAAECDEVRVKLRRNGIQVDLWGGAALSLKDLPYHLAAPVTPSTAALEELVLGLKSLLKARQFTISDSSGQKYCWQNELQVSSVKPGLSNIVLWVSRSRLVSRAWKARESVEYFELLVQRALFAPLKLTCDGQEISPETLPSHELLPRHLYEAWASPVHLMAARVNSSRPKLSLAQAGPARDSLRCREPFLKVSPESGLPHLQMHLFLSYRTRQKEKKIYRTQTINSGCRMHFGRLGVICESRETADLPCGALIYHEVGAKSGDLSGLQISSTEGDWDEFVERTKTLQPCFETLCQQMENHSTRLHYYKPTKVHRKSNVTTGAFLPALFFPFYLAAGLKCLVIGPAAVAGGALLGLVEPYFNLSKLSKADLEQWTEAVDNFRQSDEWTRRIRYELRD